MQRALALCLLAACGRLAFDASTQIDAPMTPPDAAAPGCAVTPISAVATTATTSGMSLFAGTCGGGSAPELVLPFEAPASSTVFVSADDQSPNTVVYVASTCPPAPELACDQDHGINDGGMLSFLATSAGRYYAFADVETATSSVSLTGRIEVLLPAGAACTGVPMYWRCGPELACMANGHCEQPGSCPAPDAVLMGSTAYSLMGTTSGAANHHGSTCGDAATGGRLAPERYYQLVLPAAVTNVTLTTNFPETDFDTLMYVRRDCFGNEIACVDDTTTNNAAALDTGPLAAGTYHVFVDGFSYTQGTFRLDVTITP